MADPRTLSIQVFHARRDAALAGLFLAPVGIVVASAVREWLKILEGERPLMADPPKTQASVATESAFGKIPRSAGGARCR